MSQREFTPVVKGGYKSDAALHKRNWHALQDYLRTNNATPAAGSITDDMIASVSPSKLLSGTLATGVEIDLSMAVMVLPKSADPPDSPESGQIYFDTSDSKAYVWDGAIWNALW